MSSHHKNGLLVTNIPERGIQSCTLLLTSRVIVNMMVRKMDCMEGIVTLLTIVAKDIPKYILSL